MLVKTSNVGTRPASWQRSYPHAGSDQQCWAPDLHHEYDHIIILMLAQCWTSGLHHDCDHIIILMLVQCWTSDLHQQCWASDMHCATKIVIIYRCRQLQPWFALSRTKNWLLGSEEVTVYIHYWSGSVLSTLLTVLTASKGPHRTGLLDPKVRFSVQVFHEVQLLCVTHIMVSFQIDITFFVVTVGYFVVGGYCCFKNNLNDHCAKCPAEFPLYARYILSHSYL